MMNWSRSRLAAVFYFLVAAPVTLNALSQHAAPRSPASEFVLEIDPAQSKLHWTLDTTLHTVHGTFALKKGTFHLDPATGKASGEIIVDATSGNSGNDSRDKKMHKEVLESGQYPDVIFRPDRVAGKITPQGTFTVQVHGIFVLHGHEHADVTTLAGSGTGGSCEPSRRAGPATSVENAHGRRGSCPV